jgi:adenine-specific DNA-methyltransferase
MRDDRPSATGLRDWPVQTPGGAPDAVEDERYELRWPGKAAALRLADAPSQCALVPDGGVDAASSDHLFIDGDNLDALKLLLPSYAGRVQLIYIDPPYNTGGHFIFDDKYGASLRPGHRCSAEATGRRHARWLSMLYPRLLLAYRLLRNDGALCLSIGEEEVSHARLLLDEVFGEHHHRNTLAVRRFDKNLSLQFLSGGLASLAVGFEYVLIYARGDAFTMRPVFREPSPRRQTHGYWKGFWNNADRPTMRYPLLGVMPAAGQWKWREAIAREAVENYHVYQEHYAATMTLEDYWEHTGRSKRFIRRASGGRGHNAGVEHWIPPSQGILRTSNWTDVLASTALDPLGLHFDNPKSLELIELLVRLCGQPDGVVLDFFAGSATTGHAVLALNQRDGGSRHFILVQRPEPTGDPALPTISAIARERLRRALAATCPPDATDAEAPAGTAPSIAYLRVAPLDADISSSVEVG